MRARQSSGKKISTFYPYLDDIRQRVYGLAVIFLALFTIGFLSSGVLLRAVVLFFTIPGVSIVTTSPFQFVDLAMTIGILMALIGCIPLCVYHLYAFLKDCLHTRERFLFFLLLPASALLFALGFAYGFGVLYYALSAIAALNISLGTPNLWDIGRFLSQIGVSAALLGLLFQFPIILIFLLRGGIMSPDFLKSKWRHAIMIILIFTALLPPTDGLSLVIMVVPLIVLYVCVSFMAPFIVRRRTVA